MDQRTSLIGLTQEELTQAVLAMGESAFRAKQLWHWIYSRGVTSFDAMHNINKALKERLNEHYTLERPGTSKHQLSNDGTQKWLLKFSDANEAETVFIPEDDRGTLCVSSQVGCTLNCSFCHTGTQPMVRNLTASEIISQVMLARDTIGDWPSTAAPHHLSNIVFMGMGEPMYNYDNVRNAILIMLDQSGLAFSRRRVTVSTSGIVPMINQLGADVNVRLAISLHAVRDDLRDELVPINKKYPLKELLEACRHYPNANAMNCITFEYVMLKDVNDSDADARELVRILKGISAKVNLIPFNPWPGTIYECSEWNRIERFSEIVYEAGIQAPIRRPRGRDILAACGQLKSESIKERKSVVRERESQLVQITEPLSA
ncbi:MAG: 23S rRNA (adenine(2503)-C(2))-methyltransferase RlmN [Alphaproteobacteria bacterium]|nr:23S rRNA (adenine(2503)-C(2))-methyltransferase RlmN [Alphaproteobacteria bacterium]